MFAYVCSLFILNFGTVSLNTAIIFIKNPTKSKVHLQQLKKQGMSETDWRRRWKPDLKCKPWLNLAIENQTVFVKSYFTQQSYEILVTDTSRIWIETVNGESVKKRSLVCGNY